MSFLYFYLWIASPLFEWKSEDRAPGTAPVLFRGVQGNRCLKKKPEDITIWGYSARKKTNPGWKIQNPNSSQETVNIVKWMKQHLRNISKRTGWWRETSGVHQPLVLKSTPWHICWSVEKMAPAFLKLQITTHSLQLLEKLNFHAGKPFASL